MSNSSKRRTHPYDPHISNGALAKALIFLTRHRIPGLTRIYTAFLNCDIAAALPASVFLPHPFGIIITGRAKLGDDVVIGHQVTLGNRNGEMAGPTIGNRVYIGTGAKIFGAISVGDDAMIGANAVVTKDVPAKARVVGANRILSGTHSGYWQCKE